MSGSGKPKKSPKKALASKEQIDTSPVAVDFRKVGPDLIRQIDKTMREQPKQDNFMRELALEEEAGKLMKEAMTVLFDVAWRKVDKAEKPKL